MRMIWLCLYFSFFFLYQLFLHLLRKTAFSLCVCENRFEVYTWIYSPSREIVPPLSNIVFWLNLNFRIKMIWTNFFRNHLDVLVVHSPNMSSRIFPTIPLERLYSFSLFLPFLFYPCLTFSSVLFPHSFPPLFPFLSDLFCRSPFPVLPIAMQVLARRINEFLGAESPLFEVTSGPIATTDHSNPNFYPSRMHPTSSAFRSDSDHIDSQNLPSNTTLEEEKRQVDKPDDEGLLDSMWRHATGSPPSVNRSDNFY